MTVYECVAPSATRDMWLAPEWDGPPEQAGLARSPEGAELRRRIHDGEVDRLPFAVRWRRFGRGTRHNDLVWDGGFGRAKIAGRRLVDVLKALDATGYRTFEVDVRDIDGTPIDGYVGVATVDTGGPADIASLTGPMRPSGFLVGPRVAEAFVAAGLQMELRPYDPRVHAVDPSSAVLLRPDAVERLDSGPLAAGDGPRSRDTLLDRASGAAYVAAHPLNPDWSRLPDAIETLTQRVLASTWPRDEDGYPAWARELGLPDVGWPDTALDDLLPGSVNRRAEWEGLDVGWRFVDGHLVGIHLVGVVDPRDVARDRGGECGDGGLTDAACARLGAPQDGAGRGSRFDGPRLESVLRRLDETAHTGLPAGDSSGEAEVGALISVRAVWCPPSSLLPGGRARRGSFQVTVEDLEAAAGAFVDVSTAPAKRPKPRVRIPRR